MEPREEKAPTKKSLVSIVALVALLLILVYAAPMLEQKISEWTQRGETESTDGVESENDPTPVVAAELKQLLPQVEKQLPKGDDGSAKFRLLHMRLSEDGSQLLLDLEEADGNRRDVILTKDQFGRYISSDDDPALKLYPPTD